MKKIITLTLIIISFLSYSCNNEDDSTPTVQETNSSLTGNWIIDKYDGMTLTSPAYGTFDVTAESETSGSAKFKISFDGSAISDESDNFTTSNNNSTIVFTKTGGIFNVLAGGENWTINTLNNNNLKMTSSYGLIIEMHK